MYEMLKIHDLNISMKMTTFSFINRFLNQVPTGHKLVGACFLKIAFVKFCLRISVCVRACVYGCVHACVCTYVCVSVCICV